jgi:hypothetical protein
VVVEVVAGVEVVRLVLLVRQVAQVAVEID